MKVSPSAPISTYWELNQLEDMLPQCLSMIDVGTCVGINFPRGKAGNLGVGAHPTANYGTLTLRRKGCTQYRTVCTGTSVRELNVGLSRSVSTSPKLLSQTQREELGGQFIADRDSVHARPRWDDFEVASTGGVQLRTVQVETLWKTIRRTGRVRLGEVLRERAGVFVARRNDDLACLTSGDNFQRYQCGSGI